LQLREFRSDASGWWKRHLDGRPSRNRQSVGFPAVWIDAELLREIGAYFVQECHPGTNREKGKDDERRK
jgi:hypothetical protein